VQCVNIRLCDSSQHFIKIVGGVIIFVGLLLPLGMIHDTTSSLGDMSATVNELNLLTTAVLSGGCFLWGIFIFAFGELIYLLMDIEENTRNRLQQATLDGVATASSQWTAQRTTTIPTAPCPVCNTQNPVTANICTNCGKMLG
jgi:hypothetical protein